MIRKHNTVKWLLKNFGITEMEITDEVFRSKYGRQFEEAEKQNAFH